MKQFAIIALAALAMSACTKVIDIDLKDAAPKLVIEGAVRNDGPAKVSISRSVVFGSSNTYPVVTGATVQISDNAGNSYTLAETQPGIYTNPLLVGQPGRAYTLRANVEGKTYTAQSTMPQQVPFIDMYQDTVFVSEKLIVTAVHFIDPVGFGNYYHFAQTVNGKRNKTVFITDDTFQDGGDIDEPLIDEDMKLKVGDVVKIEMQTIDKAVYRYLRGLEDLQLEVSVPANPDSNISNGALGFFSAHTAQTKTIVIR